MADNTPNRVDVSIERRVSYQDHDTGLYFYFDPDGQSHYYADKDECLAAAALDWDLG